MDGYIEFFGNCYNLELNPETISTLLYSMAKEIEYLRNEVNELRNDIDYLDDNCVRRYRSEEE